MSNDESAGPAFLGRYAGFVTRLVAFVVDRAIVSIIVLFTLLSIRYALSAFEINRIFGFQSIPPNVAAIFAASILVILTVSYDLGFWMLAGQTPGKYLMGLRIVLTDGEALHLGNAIRREIGYIISAILFIGFLWILLDNRRQGFHDKLAGTFVVYSWPEGELKGTFVVEKVETIRRRRQVSRGQESL